MENLLHTISNDSVDYHNNSVFDLNLKNLNRTLSSFISVKT